MVVKFFLPEVGHNTMFVDGNSLTFLESHRNICSEMVMEPYWNYRPKFNSSIARRVPTEQFRK